MKTFILSLTLSLLVFSGCARRMPVVDMSPLDPGYLKRCKQGPGLLVLLDERTEAIWGDGYDKTKWLLLGEEKGGDLGRAPTIPMVIHRSLTKILSPAGAKKASTFQVIHYKEQLPPVEIHVWQADGQPRPVNLRSTQTLPLADWHCEHSWPRLTTFRVATLKEGDLVELIRPLNGPDMLEWDFASSDRCVWRSRAQLGHPDDTYRLALQARVVDPGGKVKRTSEAEAYPMILEHDVPTLPMADEDVPRLRYSQECKTWSHIRARAFNTALWLARQGDLEGKAGVHPLLLKPVQAGEAARRARAAMDWLSRHVELEIWAGSRWMRWMPRLAPATVLRRRAADAGSAAVLLFAILERAGLKPRFALLHTDLHRPFRADQPDLAQFDRLGLVFDDEAGKTHWLLPGLPYDPADQPPRVLKGRHALVLERYWLDRHQGSGRCQPEVEVPWSCQIATPAPIELRLMEIGEDPKAPE